jgi:hypothetical protein
MPKMAYFARAKYKNVCFLLKIDIYKHRTSEPAHPIFDRAIVNGEGPSETALAEQVRHRRAS